MVRISEFDFAHPTGIIGLVLVVLSLVAFVVGLVLRVQGDEAASYGNWYVAADLYMAAIYTFVGALIGVIIGGIFLFINRKIKMKRIQQGSQLPIPPQYPPQQSPPSQPTCPICKGSLTYVEQYNQWYCNNCRKYV